MGYRPLTLTPAIARTSDSDIDGNNVQSMFYLL